MSRLTDERIDEILRPKELIGETELESLAREVRELRHKLKEAEASGMLFSPVEMVQQIERLTRERDDMAELRAEYERVKSDLESAGCIIRNRDAQNKQLTRELADASRTIDLQSRQISHQARQCQEIEDELAASREFNRRWRAARGVGDWENVAEDYDATQTQQPQPTKTELVPWDSETRPKGPVTLRRRDRHWYEFTPAWEMDGDASGGYRISWKELCVEYEWSRDGITWQRCGVVR